METENQGKYQALESVEAMQVRPEMYIGETDNPDHLGTEVIDNALDELSNGHATHVDVHITDDNQFWVSDNGRGLEIYQMTLKGGEVKNSIEVLFTKSHSGSKFNSDDYKSVIGMNGVGLVAVNALSDWVVVQVTDKMDRSIAHKFVFQFGKMISEEIIPNPNPNMSTTVGFKPGDKYFETTNFSVHKYVERLLLVQSKYLDANLSFNQKVIPKITYYEFAKRQLKLEKDIALCELEYETQDQSIKAFVTFMESPDINIVGETNLRICEGKFLTSFQTELRNQLKVKLGKKFKNIPQSQLLSGLRAYVGINIPEPKFDSQTKVRMTKNVKKDLIDPLKDQIDWLLNQPDIMSTITTNLEKKFQIKISRKTSTRKRTSASNKLKDCLNTPGKVLYILEGDSALGTLKQFRCEKTEAIFPLKGKVLNVESNSLSRIDGNKEVQHLLEALGPKTKRRYEYIKLIADADVDGAHIVVLLILFLVKYADDYIKAGKVSVILPPLWGATKGKKFVPIYKDKQLQHYEQQGYEIMRFKGLGEMSPAKLEPVVRSGFEYTLRWPEEEAIVQNTISVVTDTSIKRAIMNSKKCTFDNIIDDIIKNLKSKIGGNTDD